MRSAHQAISCPVLICLVALTNANNLEVGDECKITRTGNKGICRFLTSCEDAQNDIRFNAMRPTSCGYQGFKQIICCPIKEFVAEPMNRVDNSDSRIAIQKCKEYSRYVYSNISVISFEPNATARTKRIDRCGDKGVSACFVPHANAREFPHSALLGYKKSDGQIAWDCGGSLISTRYVLTSAHCQKSPIHNINVSVVRLGELVLNDETDDASVIDVPVELILAHPNYRRSSRYNDIALLKLAHKVTLSPYIRPICLPTVDLNPAKLIASGWGPIEFAGPNSNALLKIILQSYNNSECNYIFRYNQDRKFRKSIIETQICAGLRDEYSHIPCYGSGGDALQIYHPDIYCMYTQVGVTSFGIGCGSTIDVPTVYTRVYNYVEWIEQIIWAAGEDD